MPIVVETPRRFALPKEDHRDHGQVRLGEVLRELADLNVAIEVVLGLIRTEKRVASVALCTSLRPDHDKLAKAFAKQVIALHAAQKNIRRISGFD